MGKRILIGLCIVVGLFTLLEFAAPGHYNAFVTYVGTNMTNFMHTWFPNGVPVGGA